MASNPDFVTYVCESLKGVGVVHSRKMFGDYQIYVNDKPVLLVCDDTIFIKKLPCLEGLLNGFPTGLPYEGAKERYILDPDDREMLQRAAALAEAVTPTPRKRTPKKKTL